MKWCSPDRSRGIFWKIDSSMLKAYRLVSSLPSCSLPLQKQCYLCSHGDAPPKPYSAIPGPKPWPILGNVLEMSANRSYFQTKYIHEGFKKYGDIYKLDAFGMIEYNSS